MNLPALSSLEQRIFLIRGQKVILSPDLAELYEVEPRALIQAVKRNSERFPEDFMFLLTDKEFLNLKSQFVISSWGGARRSNPYAFTEQGVAMLSGLLKSPRAVQANIAIMRTFVALRNHAANNKLFADTLAKLEQKISDHDEDIETIFSVLRQLTAPEAKKKHPLGFI